MVTVNSLHIATENDDVISYFRSAANRDDYVDFYSFSSRGFSITTESVSKVLTVLDRGIQVLHLSLCKSFTNVAL